jgi:hypothetical protein
VRLGGIAGHEPFPVLLVEGKFPADADDLPLGGDRDGDLTFAVRVGCATCGYLMLFDSARYRTGDEKILVLGLERESQREQ